jgi:hypothetical protein
VLVSDGNTSTQSTRRESEGKFSTGMFRRDFHKHHSAAGDGDGENTHAGQVLVIRAVTWV